MIDINFFEKDKKNMSPYILVGIFVLGLIVILTTSYLIFSQIVQQKEANLAKIEKQTDMVNEYQEVQLLQNQVSEIESQVSQIVDIKYPTVQLYEYVKSAVPSNTIIIDYRFSLPGELYIRVHLTDLDC